MLEERFRNLGRLEDLENAISDYQKAAEFTEPNNDAYRSTVLCKLEAALRVHLEKVAKLRLNDRQQPTCHYKLGDAFLERFERFNRLEDLDARSQVCRSRSKLSQTGTQTNQPFLNASSMHSIRALSS